MRFSFFLIALLCFFLVFARSNANSDDLSVFGIRPRMSLDEFKLAAKTYSCRIVDKDDAGEETEYWLSKTVADKFLITTKDGAILQVSPLSHPSEGLESLSVCDDRFPKQLVEIRPGVNSDILKRLPLPVKRAKSGAVFLLRRPTTVRVVVDAKGVKFVEGHFLIIRGQTIGEWSSLADIRKQLGPPDEEDAAYFSYRRQGFDLEGRIKGNRILQLGLTRN